MSKPNIDSGVNVCAVCGHEKPASELRFKIVKKEWVRMCKECRAKVKSNT